VRSAGHQPRAKARRADAEQRLRRYQTAIAADVDPVALVEAINQRCRPLDGLGAEHAIVLCAGPWTRPGWPRWPRPGRCWTGSTGPTGPGSQTRRTGTGRGRLQ
jgi:hypothetical protein